jgi:ribosomal biogenesis protein LAS1
MTRILPISLQQWTPGDMAMMDQRLTAVLSVDSDAAQPPLQLPERRTAFMATSGDLPTGWRLLDDDSRWKPCPIGVYVDLI